MGLVSSLLMIRRLVQVLLDKEITFAIDHWRGAGAGPDLPKALENLREVFNIVWEVFNIVQAFPISQKIRRENEGLLKYVKDLKDAAYEAEDILSELDYYRLQEEAEGGLFSQLFLTNEETQASTSSPPPSVFDIKDTKRRISKVVARLDRIIPHVSIGVLPLLKPAEERDADSHVSTSHCVTTSFVASKETMFGREDTKAQIIDLLLNGQPAAAASDVCVLPIIGAGGIGKTTLAREVYNDKRVVEHFDCTLWLYVSDNFDVPRLTREMLEILGVDGSSQMKSLERLQKLLKENLCSKKFLLVMDDVWNDAESQKWKTLCGPLECGKTGSRILLTTRLDTVVEMVGKEAMNVFGCSVKLKGLPEEEYLSLFNKYAFGDEEPSDHSNLAEIGKQIAGKLGGSPLAAKTVGSLLRENLDAEHWRSILSSDIWKLPQRRDDIMPVLKLSYQHLPVHLQQCFAYCCVFPKGWVFNGYELVRMWIAHGYIDTKTSGNKRMEDIGWEYFKILLARSFLEHSFIFDKHVVHDLFHDLAQSVSADESFIIDTNNQIVPRRVRHLTLSSNDITLVLQKSYLRNLRTLIIMTPPFYKRYDLLGELLKGLKSVRVLVLYIPWRLYLKDFPHNIEHLIHLRYLLLQNRQHNFNFREYRAPSSLCRLYHLQYLDVDTESLHLPRIENLTCLQELNCFIIDEGRKIGELKNLNQLGGSLTLENLENVYTKEEALEAKLSKKMHIRNLSLKWKDSRTLPEVAEEVFEGIRPPAYIKELFIDGYGGVNTPSWMVHEIRCFSNLESLYLFNCLKWKDLPPLGELPFLRHLKISKADAVEVIGRGFYGTGDAKGFQCLETLEFVCMPQLVVWSGIGDDSGFLFPRLGKLTIKGCPKLQQVPMKDLTSLKELITNCMSLLVHPECLLSLEKLYIIEFEEPLLSMSVELKSFPSLKQVTLKSCNRLQSLPLLPDMLEVLELDYLGLLTGLTRDQGEDITYLTSLRELCISHCSHLNFLPLLPVSLKKLSVIDCPKLLRERYQEGGEDWYKVSHIWEQVWVDDESFLDAAATNTDWTRTSTSQSGTSTCDVRIIGIPTGQDPPYQEGRKIGELKTLNQLGGSLTLENLENIYTKEEALEAELPSMDMASSLTVIGWLVQVQLDQGINFAIDHWVGTGAAPVLPTALEGLWKAIKNVRALLPIAWKIRSENEGLLESVKELKYAAYDAEDILSELDYYRLSEVIEGNDNSNNSSSGGKVTTKPRIDEVVARLNRIIADVSRVLALLKPEDPDADLHVSTSHRVTTSFVSSKQTIFGREDTKAHIIDMLLNGQPEAAVCVLPIIGAGGIGKTTLARLVYNDKRVVEHFDCRLWLYVSDNFDVPRLTRDMLESLGVQGSKNITDLDQLQTLLYENLCSKKFLLVMDDVWNDADSQKWKTLCGPLEYGKTGSSILLTTRLDTVVRMVREEAMNVFGCSVKLKGLPEEEYLSLFNKYAFGDEEPSDHSNLAEIGKQIAGKLDGSPLAAKTVGSLLRENLDVDHWKSILSSDIWKLPQHWRSILSRDMKTA